VPVILHRIEDSDAYSKFKGATSDGEDQRSCSSRGRGISMAVGCRQWNGGIRQTCQWT
jgi:hypothetical protein